MEWISAQIDSASAGVIVMMGFVSLAMGTIALLFLSMKRAAARRDPHVDALLEELENEERETARRARRETKPTPTQAWERNADWWKAG